MKAEQTRSCFILHPSSLRLHPLFLAVGVGIEPTFRAFQTRANPSQLSDLLKIRSLVFGVWTLNNSQPMKSRTEGTAVQRPKTKAQRPNPVPSSSDHDHRGRP